MSSKMILGYNETPEQKALNDKIDSALQRLSNATICQPSPITKIEREYVDAIQDYADKRIPVLIMI